MAFELIHTSAPEGIRPGSSGFCIVAYTNGLSANIALQLENLSAYKAYFPHYDENADRNPVACSHYMSSISGDQFHILSRICFCGLDYTKRSNKLAHHLVITEQELQAVPRTDPAAVFRQQDLFRSFWEGKPQLFQKQRQINSRQVGVRAATWEKYAGDAGWAAVLAQSFLDKTGNQQAFIVFDPLKHPDTLGLLEEALLLLPEEKRWSVNFSTYFTHLPAGFTCDWRFCVPDSDALKNARRVPGTLIIDLTAPLSPVAEETELVRIARRELLPVVPVKAEPLPEPAVQTIELPAPEPLPVPPPLQPQRGNPIPPPPKAGMAYRAPDRQAVSSVQSSRSIPKRIILKLFCLLAGVCIILVGCAFYLYHLFTGPEAKTTEVIRVLAPPPVQTQETAPANPDPKSEEPTPDSNPKSEEPTPKSDSTPDGNETMSQLKGAPVKLPENDSSALTSKTPRSPESDASQSPAPPKTPGDDDTLRQGGTPAPVIETPQQSKDNTSSQKAQQLVPTECAKGERISEDEMLRRTLWTKKLGSRLLKFREGVSFSLPPGDEIVAVEIDRLKKQPKNGDEVVAGDHNAGCRFLIKKEGKDTWKITNQSSSAYKSTRHMVGIYVKDLEEMISFLWLAGYSMLPDDNTAVTITAKDDKLILAYVFSPKEEEWMKGVKADVKLQIGGQEPIGLTQDENKFVSLAVTLKRLGLEGSVSDGSDREKEILEKLSQSPVRLVFSVDATKPLKYINYIEVK